MKVTNEFVTPVTKRKIATRYGSYVSANGNAITIVVFGCTPGIRPVIVPIIIPSSIANIDNVNISNI